MFHIHPFSFRTGRTDALCTVCTFCSEHTLSIPNHRIILPVRPNGPSTASAVYEQVFRLRIVRDDRVENITSSRNFIAFCGNEHTVSRASVIDLRVDSSARGFCGRSWCCVAPKRINQRRYVSSKNAIRFQNTLPTGILFFPIAI